MEPRDPFPQYEGKKREWVVPLCYAIAAACGFTAVLVIAAFRK